jgi:uncharacterized protein DUF4339
MPTKEWFCQINGVEIGPIESPQLAQLAACGSIKPNDLVRLGRDGAWIGAWNVRGLFAANVAQQPPITPPPLPASSPVQTPTTSAIPMAVQLPITATVESNTDSASPTATATIGSEPEPHYEDSEMDAAGIFIVLGAVYFAAAIAVFFVNRNIAIAMIFGGVFACPILVALMPRIAGAVVYKLGEASRLKKEQDAKIICPHCQSKGTVATKPITEAAGVSGGKATAAALTGGLSMLATGLSRHEEKTQAKCSNCGATWKF